VRAELIPPARHLADTPRDRGSGNLVLAHSLASLGRRFALHCVFGSLAALAHGIRTSSMRTGRCSFWDLAHASAIQSASSPSATVHGDGIFPATTSRKVSNSARNAGWK